MSKRFSTSRRGFLKGTAAAIGAAALTGALGKAENLPGRLLGGATVARAEGSPYPANKVSAVLPEVNNKIDLRTPHAIKEIAPDTFYEVWTFSGSAPGPALRVREGDTVEFSMTNDGAMAHSIDFHAAQVPWNVYYGPVQPGATHGFKFTPRYPGVFMYHCGTPPVLMHLGNGMLGAIVVEPAKGWPQKAREYVLVQHEFYMGDPDDKGVRRGDFIKMSQGRPDLVVFNGYANQYQTDPLVADPGELIRIHVCNGGPTVWSAFHVIGALFEAAYPDGNPENKQVGMQTVTIPPGGGYTVELRIPDEGLYPFVTHSFAYTGLGALGVIKVGNPQVDPAMAQH